MKVKCVLQGDNAYLTVGKEYEVTNKYISFGERYTEVINNCGERYGYPSELFEYANEQPKKKVVCITDLDSSITKGVIYDVIKEVGDCFLIKGNHGTERLFSEKYVIPIIDKPVVDCSRIKRITDKLAMLWMFTPERRLIEMVEYVKHMSSTTTDSNMENTIDVLIEKCEGKK